MPRNTSAWVDLRIHLMIVIGLLLILFLYNKYLALIGLVLSVSLFVYGRERCAERQREQEEYFKNVIKNINGVANYAIESLPIAILVVGEDARLRWCNAELGRWLGDSPEIGTPLTEFWPSVDLSAIWGKDSALEFQESGRAYRMMHRPVLAALEDPLMALYVVDVTELVRAKKENAASRPVLCYIQIDNYDEVLQGLSDTQRTAITVEVNRLLDAWVGGIGAYLRRVAEDLYIAFMDRRALDKVLAEKFDILDKVRAIHGVNRFPVTLSIGVAVAPEGVPIAVLGRQAQAGLDLALGRGGDQVAVQIGGKTTFYGGKAKAVEKHTRVKARVVAHAVREIMESSDLVLIMSHHNEDFDSLGAAVGVAKMARHIGKKTHIVLSEMNEGIDKLAEMIREEETSRNLFIYERDLATLTMARPVLFVVDTHIPAMTAVPALLKRVEQVVVIDHHRRSERFVANPFLVYIEPASSSTSELVTELLMYFADDLKLSRMDATALYAGMVVDTKNFAVQTGVRTFDAAAYLRRSGADPAVVRHLFRADYETSRAKARTIGDAEFLPCGLIVGVCPPNTQGAQILAAQVADTMLRIEKVRMSLVLFHMDGGVGISARSTGETNVQVIMEHFGGGGHQNVAGAQVKGADMEKLRDEVISFSVHYIEESDKQ